jgi:uncharacterized protein
MRLDISRLRGGREEEHVERVYPADAFALEHEEFSLTAPVALTVDVRRDAKKIHLTGRVVASLETSCGRCLDPFAVPVDAELDLMYLPASEPADVKAADESEHEIAEEDLGVSFYRDDEIDLGEVMREQFILAMPMKPLCRADCQGLCPVCGNNRNRERCACQTEWVDPRMEPLRRFKDSE